MFDERNILGQKEANGKFGGGDSLSWHGGLTMLGASTRNFFRIFGLPNGGLRRHPNEGYSAYYKGPYDGRITRDQLSGALAAIVSQRDSQALWLVFKHHMYWLLLFSYSTRPNGSMGKWKWPDITFFNVWQLYVRGLINRFPILKWPLFPALCGLDVHLVLDSLVMRYNDDSHIISHLNRLLPAVENTPTPISWLAFKLLPNSFIRDNLDRYWCGWRDNCFMVGLYMKKITALR